MDRLEHYRNCIESLLEQYARGDKVPEGVNVELVFDRQRDRYLWMHVGWQELHRVYNCFVHLDIQDGKIWLQQNLTDCNPAEDLVEMGVPREDIILGLQAPYKRQYTDYGVA